MRTENILLLLISVAVTLFSITMHECAHGYMAYFMGDDTPKIYKRLSLNPLRHIDWVGALCLVLFHFGWAKPVPINLYNLKNNKAKIFMVSIAGILTNLIIAFLSLILFCYSKNKYLLYGLKQMVYLNLGLAVFNIIPIPPLDGSRIVSLFLKGGAKYRYESIERYGFVILFVLLSVPVFSNYFNTFLNFCVNNIVWVYLKVVGLLPGVIL